MASSPKGFMKIKEFPGGFFLDENPMLFGLAWKRF